MSIWRNIDLEYDSRCPVLHDDAGLEVARALTVALGV